jgi:hypothetical protein
MTGAVTQTVTDFFYWGTKNQGLERRNGKASRILDFGNRLVVSLTVRFNYDPEISFVVFLMDVTRHQ